jgi:RNA polymerase sigma factor (sigma-70 family)
MNMALDADASPSDAELLARYADGDQSAARELTLRLVPRVLALARRMLGDASEAEDVAQEAMMRLWKIAPDWRTGEARLSTWLYRVANNLCLDRLRRRKIHVSDAVAEIVDDASGTLSLLEAGDRAKALDAALSTLPDRQRLAVVLRHLEERSNPEIATILETSTEAVESLLARGKRQLAAQLAPRRSDLGYE